MILRFPLVVGDSIGYRKGFAQVSGFRDRVASICGWVS